VEEAELFARKLHRNLEHINHVNIGSCGAFRILEKGPLIDVDDLRRLRFSNIGRHDIPFKLFQMIRKIPAAKRFWCTIKPKTVIPVYLDLIKENKN